MAGELAFISMTGTQAMGTWNVWTACEKHFGTMPAWLLYTRDTAALAGRLADMARSRNMGHVELVPVGDSLEGPDSPATVAERLGAELAELDVRACFNLNGALNYLITPASMALLPFQPLFVSASWWNVVVYDTKSGRFYTIPLPHPESVPAILELQGVEYSQSPENVRDFCAGRGIKLPKDSMFDVCVDGIVFDVVWTPGNNRLSFLKDLRREVLPTSKDYKIRDRNLANWAVDRSRCGQLHDKRLYVIVRDDKTEQRLAAGSHGSITTFNWLRDKSGEGLAASLQGCFGIKAGAGKFAELKPPAKSSAEPMRDDTLVVCMGRPADSTWLAVFSHKPRHLVVCYTDNIATVVEQVEKLEAIAPEIGIESFIRVPFPFEGSYTDERLPPPPLDKNARVYVNMSPGTKAQGAMLALWAKKHGYSVWSIDNGARLLQPLLNARCEKPKPLRLCDPALIFRLRGKPMLYEGATAKDLEPHMPFMENFLQFLRASMAEGRDRDRISAMRKAGPFTFDFGGWSRLVLRRGDEEFSFDSERGKWLEYLAAASLLKAGAGHIRVNPMLPWKKSTEAAIAQKHGEGQGPHMLEVDVVGEFEGDLVLISCKSTFSGSREKGDDIETAAKGAHDDATHFGRFGLSILAHMGCAKTCVAEGSVRVIGWRELCRPDVLAGLIRELRESRRTTAKTGNGDGV